MKTRLKIILFLLVTLSAVGCDRVTKNLAKAHLAFQEPISYFDDFVRLEYAENTGAAMSLGAHWSDTLRFWLFLILPLATLLLLLAYTAWNAAKLNRAQVLAMALIFSGGLGNLTDRFLYDSRVPDFMILGTENLRTGIFNVADVWITAGVLLLLAAAVFEKR
jgi:signal peptidase II